MSIVDTESTEGPDVTAWRGAFLAANGKEPDQVPQYEDGWFIWRNAIGWISSRVRRQKLCEMTNVLRERTNART